MLFRYTRVGVRAAVLLAAGLALLCFASPVWASPASVSPTLPPHVPTEIDTDVCAMCHRAHTSANTDTWTSHSAADATGSSLLVGSESGGDTGMCYTCHGVELLGSATDIQSSFEASSGHSIEPSVSAFGPRLKDCSTCHDSHGSARAATGTPYARLLRVETASETLVYRGDEFCTACHAVRVASSFPGLATWKLTRHADITATASATGIVCTACHDSHGSPFAPSIRTRLTTPSASAAATVTGNTRSLCVGCHSTAYGIWQDATAYGGSSHASSTATTTIPGEWPAVGSARRVGECQVCHAPMGKLDASGTLTPNLLQAEGRTLCDSCHDASGPAATDFAQLAYKPSGTQNEVIAAYSPSSSPAYGRLQVFGRDTSATGAPKGPRELAPLDASGAFAAGDIDGDGFDELVVADALTASVAIVNRDAASITTQTITTLPGGDAATHLAIGDVFADASNLNEIVWTTANGDVRVASLAGSSLMPEASASIAATATGLAVGDLLGSASDEIAVCAVDPDGLYVLGDDGLGGLTSSGPFATKAQPAGVAIADLDGEAIEGEIAVINAGEATDVVSAFNADGTAYEHGGGPLPSGVATDVLAANVLPGVTTGGTSGREIAIAYASPTGDSGVRVVTSPGASVVSAVDFSFGALTGASGLAFGDTDGDGDGDLAVALAGSFTHDSTAVSPRIRVLTPNGSGNALVAAFALPAGGVELAGGRARVAVADMGPLGPSRHTVGAVAGAHVTTESVPAASHVECSDCHNPHEAASVASDTAKMPARLFGAMGVRPTNLDASTVNLGSERVRATAEYEVCFSCHSAWAGAVRSIASEVNTKGASFHPIEGPAPANNASGSVLTTAATSGSTIRCTSCHGTSNAAYPDGPHRSPDAPLLSRPYLGTAATDDDTLCLACHRRLVYVTGDLDGVAGTQSGFYDSLGAGAAQKLHSYHATTLGMTCSACHRSHGAPGRKHILRGDSYFTWTESGTGGTCLASCHQAVHDYDR